MLGEIVTFTYKSHLRLSMAKKNANASRRDVIKMFGAGATMVGTTTQVVSAETNQQVSYRTLRGTLNNPINRGEIRSVRSKIQKETKPAEDSSVRSGSVDLKETFNNDRIIGYNAIIDTDGELIEQYTVQQDWSPSKQDSINTQSGTNELQAKADDLLRHKKNEVRQSSEGSTNADVAWDSWTQIGSTDVYFKPTVTGSALLGRALYNIDIRQSSENSRVGARSKVKMEPGTLLCDGNIDNADAYCTPRGVSEYYNVGASIYHDWDQPYNRVSREELIEDSFPTNSISNTTTTKSVSMQLSRSPSGPSGTIGYSTSVTVPGATVRNDTIQGAGQTHHEFDVKNPSELSSKSTAEIPVGSIAEWDPSCKPNYGDTKYLKIKTDLKWGKNGLLGFDGVKTVPRNFSYSINCDL